MVGWIPGAARERQGLLRASWPLWDNGVCLWSPFHGSWHDSTYLGLPDLSSVEKHVPWVPLPCQIRCLLRQHRLSHAESRGWREGLSLPVWSQPNCGEMLPPLGSGRDPPRTSGMWPVPALVTYSPQHCQNATISQKLPGSPFLAVEQLWGPAQPGISAGGCTQSTVSAGL